MTVDRVRGSDDENAAYPAIKPSVVFRHGGAPRAVVSVDLRPILIRETRLRAEREQMIKFTEEGNSDSQQNIYKIFSAKKLPSDMVIA